MHIERLAAGTKAAEATDRVRIIEFGDGLYGWNAVIGSKGEPIFGVGEHEGRSYDLAEAEALAWMGRMGVSRVFVEIDSIHVT